MKNLTFKVIFALFLPVFANAADNSGRWSLGFIQSKANLSTNEVTTFYGGFNDGLTYKTSSFSDSGLSVGYKNKINKSWLSQEWFWETNLFLGSNSNSEKKTLVSNLSCTDDFFSGPFASTISCDLISEQSSLSWVLNLLTRYNLPASWKLLYGGGFGYYRIDQKLLLSASGHEDSEFETKSESSISPQGRLGLLYKNIEITYSFTPNVGGSDTGSGHYQQLGIFYVFGSE
jgi:hypothetical protein